MPSLFPTPENGASRGANLRRLDHVNLLVPNPAGGRTFFADVLRAKLPNQIIFSDVSMQAVWFSVTNKSY